MAVITYKYAMILGEDIMNIALFEDYVTANEVTKIVYGENAFAVDIKEWPVGPGYKYKNGVFYEPDGETLVDPLPSADSKIETMKVKMNVLQSVATMAAFSFTDEQSLAVKDIYPIWSELSEGTLLTKKEDAKTGTEITKVLGDDGKLYKVIVTHNKQSDWAPRQATASLFTVIEENHEGTEEDPIPYSVNMIVYEGKYYTYNGVLYKCIRDSGIALQYTPDQLIDQYFQLVI